MNIQFKKGVLELCVLSLLSRDDYYGYELVKQISNNVRISEGTIYPLLRRLTKENYFETYLKESSEGPPRKYYTLTKKGHEAKELLGHEWYDFVSRVNSLIEEEDSCE